MCAIKHFAEDITSVYVFIGQVQLPSDACSWQYLIPSTTSPIPCILRCCQPPSMQKGGAGQRSSASLDASFRKLEEPTAGPYLQRLGAAVRPLFRSRYRIHDEYGWSQSRPVQEPILAAC
ncbi:uncharacterized protein PV09_03257 [Verruconis gallopava]|uniref:Uncharacterized protein n=1 Tax=Verruconis gallopava TaxID=253628 RepID=A0A0D1XTM2_9PEZI|nr:uncharacterized protein PV09_03257 [Verruconis gallopava]KIW06086.1 hypothetical protein PV09_03257 [Verruconis gallopava]